MRLVSFILLLVSWNIVFSQETSPCDNLGQGPGLIINEIGNTVAYSNAEFIELIVLGNPESPEENVDLSRWIIDDNDSGFQNTGHEPGHIQLGHCFNDVPPGTIILIYNDAEDIPGIDPAMSGIPNSNGVWQIPFSSTCLIGVYGPLHRDFSNSMEEEFEPTSEKDGWGSYIPMQNQGDAIQIKRPNGELFHSLYWGNIVTHPPSTGEMYYQHFDNPAAVRILKTEIGNSSVELNSDIFFNSSSYEVKRGQNGTPGVPNSEENLNVIDALSTGEISSGKIPTIVSSRLLNEYESNDGDLVADYLIFAFGASDNVITEIESDVELIETGNSQWEVLGLSGGSYDFWLTDICGERHRVTIVVGSKNTQNICSGDCTDIGENRGEDYCYRWEPESDLAEEQIFQPIIQVCPTEEITYTQIITSPDGDEITNEYTIELKNDSDLISPDPIILCSGGSIGVSVYDEYETYNWSHDEDEYTNASNVDYNHLSSATQISVTVTDDEGCVLTDIVNIFDGESPEEILAYFREGDFLVIPGIYDIVNGEPNPITNSATGGMNGDCDIYNFSNNLEFTVDIHDTPVRINLGDELSLICSEYEEDHNFYVTNNESFCSSLNLINESLSSEVPTDWFHILEGVEGVNYLIIGGATFNYSNGALLHHPFYTVAENKIEDEYSAIPWQPLTWDVLYTMTSTDVVPSFRSFNILRQAQERFPVTDADGQTCYSRGTAWTQYKMRLGAIIEDAVLNCLRLYHPNIPNYGAKNPRLIFDQYNTINEDGTKKRRYPDGAQLWVEGLRKPQPPFNYETQGLHIRWPLASQAMLHEVKISQCESIAFEPKYRTDRAQLLNFVDSFRQPRLSKEYNNFHTASKDIAGVAGIPVTRSPTISYSGVIHLITLSGNAPDEAFVSRCLQTNVVLAHSTLEYKVISNIAAPKILVRLVWNGYWTNQFATQPKFYKGYAATGQHGFRNSGVNIFGFGSGSLAFTSQQSLNFSRGAWH